MTAVCDRSRRSGHGPGVHVGGPLSTTYSEPKPVYGPFPCEGLRIDEAITVVLPLLPRRAAISGGEDKGEGQKKICQLLLRRSLATSIWLKLWQREAPWNGTTGTNQLAHPVLKHGANTLRNSIR